jgi:phosphohistidine swiveling domain-containing protein
VSGRFVFTPAGGPGADRAVLGGKAGAFAELAETGLPVPPWFAVAPAAFDASLTPPQRAALGRAGEDADAWERALADLRAAGGVADEVDGAVASLADKDDALFAVRSSAAGEDSAGHSFAGQLESFLFVPAGDVVTRVADVWRSGFTDRVIAYRRERGIPGPPVAPAVLVQRMVDARVAGVAFGADPVSGRRDIVVVSAVVGLGSALVSGEADADTFHVGPAGLILDRAIATKTVAHRADPGSVEGIRREDLGGETASAPALEDDEVLQVAGLVRAATAFFGTPQDIEWAFDGEGLWLLQSRPITSLPDAPPAGDPLPVTGQVAQTPAGGDAAPAATPAATGAEPDGELRIWDNSNIAESYAGVTTPLTFSFALHAYEEVYRELVRLLGVPERTIEQNASVFRRMLGLIDGRVYYDLLSWYRVLAMLPGFKVNRTFMEQMMGVREGLPDELVAELGGSSGTERVADAFGLARTTLGLVGAQLGLERRIARFRERLESALEPRPLDTMSADELAAYYRELEAELLAHWDAPLVNDLFAMFFYGLLRSEAQRWCGDADGTLANDLLTAQGGMISAEPARRIGRMASLAGRDPAVVHVLAHGAVDEAVRAIATDPELAAAYRTYLEEFGDRCLEELKLESPTLLDDPSPLLRSIGHAAQRMRDEGGDAGSEPDDSRSEAAMDTSTRESAELRVREALRYRPLRSPVFAWVLRNARSRVRDRENLRFERTRVFGRARRIFLAMGRELVTMDVLDDPRDVFWLEVAELLGFIEGTTTTTDLRGLVAVRRAEFEAYRAMPAPPERFETRGPVDGAARVAAPLAPSEVTGETLKGIGCCPGTVRGRARVIVDPRGATLARGEVLVAERTDPGWIMLFPAAAGILVERGSLLSHSAIVARELGIPAIVSLPGLTAWLTDGDLVEFDSATGVVRRLELADEPVTDLTWEGPRAE